MQCNGKKCPAVVVSVLLSSDVSSFWGILCTHVSCRMPPFTLKIWVMTSACITVRPMPFAGETHLQKPLMTQFHSNLPVRVCEVDPLAVGTQTRLSGRYLLALGARTPHASFADSTDSFRRGLWTVS